MLAGNAQYSQAMPTLLILNTQPGIPVGQNGFIDVNGLNFQKLKPMHETFFNEHHTNLDNHDRSVQGGQHTTQHVTIHVEEEEQKKNGLLNKIGNFLNRGKKEEADGENAPAQQPPKRKIV